MTPRSRIIYVVIAISLCVIAIVVAMSFIPMRSVRSEGRNRMYEYESIDQIPYRQVGLLLGTSKFTRSGAVNPYYYSRLRAAAELYTQRKIDIVLASGDNQFVSYNEPQEMHKTLLALGVKNEDIVLDYAGFRTLDSILRTSRVFNITDYTIITQYPHSARALYIAQQSGYDPIVYNAALPDNGLQMYFHLRELLARVKALLDIHVLNTQPRHLGPAI